MHDDGLGSEFIPDFTAEIFDVGRIHLAQDTVLWPEHGNTVIPRLTNVLVDARANIKQQT